MDTRRRHWLAGVGLAAMGGRGSFAAVLGRDGAEAIAQAAGSVDPFPRDVGPGRKFDRTGQAQRWPGCTLICHIPRPSHAFDVLCDVRDMLRTSRVNRQKLTWMPEPSYHTTVCDLFNVGDLAKRADVPADLPLDASVEDGSRHIAALLRRFELGPLPPYRLVIDPKLMQDAFLRGRDPRAFVPWVPIDAAERERMFRLRDRIFDAIGIHHAGQARYGFHTTLAYPVQGFTPSEADAWQRDYRRAMRHLAQRLPVLELGAPEFCLFESMFFFDRQFFLGANGAV